MFGLIVNDAMIAVEMMVAWLAAGDTLPIYNSTAFPMLTGTLVTVAGFIPIGLNNSNAVEFTFSLIVVIAVSLLLSWIVAVLLSPLLGVTPLSKTMKKHYDKPGRLMAAFSRLLVAVVHWRRIAILVTLGCSFVQQQYEMLTSDPPFR